MGYLGSKAASGVFQAIIALMPPHDTYIEPFVGSGVVLKRKPLCERSYAIDLDSSMVQALPELPGLTKVYGCARSFLDKFDYERSGRTLIYADPPYLHSTRTSHHRYKCEMSDLDHMALLAQLRCVPANVIISGYPSALYDANLPGWNTKEFQAMTRGGVRTEKLWFNFDATEANSTLYAGRDFTDRQRIKRKAARWAANYATLPPGERLAILSAILTADTNTDDYDAGDIDARGYGRRSAQTPMSIPAGRSAQMQMSMAAAMSSIDRDEFARASLPFPMPRSGETKPGADEVGMTEQAAMLC